MFFIAVIQQIRNEYARWIVISGLSIQPSEFAKLIIVLMLANYYNDARKLGNPKLIFFCKSFCC